MAFFSSTYRPARPALPGLPVAGKKQRKGPRKPAARSIAIIRRGHLALVWVNPDPLPRRRLRP